MSGQGTWSVAKVSSGQENRLRRSVAERWGDEAAWVPQVHAEVYDRRRRTFRSTSRTMLPGYVMIRASRHLVDQQLRGALCGGWACLMRDECGVVAVVDDAQITRMVDTAQAQEEQLVLSTTFARGSSYVLRSGPLAGERALCLGTVGRRATEAWFLVSERRVKVPLYFFR